MNRTILAIATALLSATTLFASSAQACISCSYVPEVVNTPHPAHAAKKKRVIVAKEQAARPAKKRVAKVETAKAEPVAKKAEPKKIETAAAAPVQTPAVTEASATETPVERPVSASTLLQSGGKKPAEETKVAEAEPIGCKRFIPTAGVTITVPCE